MTPRSADRDGQLSDEERLQGLQTDRALASAAVDHEVAEKRRGRQGEPGEPGEAGRAGWSDRRMIFLLCFVVLVSLVLALRSEQNSRAIRHQQTLIAQAAQQRDMDSYERCRETLAALTRYNRVQDQLAEIERTNPYTDGDIGQRRIKVYLASKVPIRADTCGQKP